MKLLSAVPSAALVGVGGYGGNHLDVLLELAASGLVRLAAVADPFEAEMPGISSDLRNAGVVWYRDCNAMLRSGIPLDLVVVATPIHLHESLALEILGAGKARILLEKPAVPTLVQLERLIAADSGERVRVGFQLMHLPQVQRLREWIQNGELGNILEVSVAAGWPRGDAYFARSAWAGRMEHGGKMVFDGPATNALSHLLNNLCYILGGGPGRLFGRVESVGGWLARARDMESYDTFFSTCRIGQAQVRCLLTHAVAEEVPFAIKVRGDLCTAVLSQTEPFLHRTDRESEERFGGAQRPQLSMYAGLLGPEGCFASLPGKLEDVRGYTEWTEGVRLAGPIREFAPGQVRKTGEGVVAVKGMKESLRLFLDGAPPPEPADGR